MPDNKKKPVTIGIDLGGTKVEMALLAASGKMVSTLRYPTRPEKGSEGIITGLITAVERMKKDADGNVQALGIGVAGQIGLEGVVLYSPNLPFKNTPLKRRLIKELGLPVIVTNDVRAAAYGEWRYGAGKGIDDLVVIFVGTGVGGGVVSGGQLLVGCSNGLGELGHITLVANGRRCRCPNLGCIEAYAGGWAIAERTREAVLEDPVEGKRLEQLAGGIEEISAATLSQAYSEGDALAKRLVIETGEYLGAGLVGIVNALNPCLLVLGGGVIEGIPDLKSIAEAVVRRHALKPSVEGLRVSKAALGGKAGAVGAAALALEKFGGGK